MTTLVVFADGHWLRIADDDEIVARGSEIAEALPVADEETVVAVLAACDVTVQTFDLPDLSSAQANAAARLAVADRSLMTANVIHAAAGPGDESGRRDVAAVESVRLSALLDHLAIYGLDPDRVLAAPLLLPRPEAGFIRAIIGDETILRGLDTGFVDDPVLTAVIVGDVAVVTPDREALEAAVVAAVTGPGADLRHGPFAKRRAWSLDRGMLRRFALMTLILGVLILVTQIVAVIRLNTTAANIESDNRAQAVLLLPAGTVVTDPVLQSEAQLTAMRGAGGGFGPLASAFATAVNATPNVELGSMMFDGEGGLRATVRAASAADLSAVETRLAASGLRAEPGPIVAGQGRPYRDITVRLP